MNFKSYTITNIDTSRENFTVKLSFEGANDIVKTLSYGANVALNDIVDEKPVVKYRKAFDLENIEALSHQIKEYAQAYINGLIKEKQSKTLVSPKVNALVGKENNVDLSK